MYLIQLWITSSARWILHLKFLLKQYNSILQKSTFNHTFWLTIFHPRPLNIFVFHCGRNKRFCCLWYFLVLVWISSAGPLALCLHWSSVPPSPFFPCLVKAKLHWKKQQNAFTTADFGHDKSAKSFPDFCCPRRMPANILFLNHILTVF